MNINLRANQLQTIHPCILKNFQHSTIHLENNPLICNCSFNYLLNYRQSLVYTGQECRTGYTYQQLTLPPIRKTNSTLIKTSINNSISCQNSYRYFNDLCSKLDCQSQCAPNERFIIQITTISTPSRTIFIYQQTIFSSIVVVVVLVHYGLLFSLV